MPNCKIAFENTNNCKLFVVCSSKIADFMECTESMFSCIKGSIYICGDFNIDLLNYNVNNNTPKKF